MYRRLFPRGDLRLMRTLSFRPSGLDPFEDVANLILGIDVGEAGHVALISLADHGGRAAPDDVEKHPVRMVPCMTGLVVRWGRQATVWTPEPPARLTFEVRTMTGGAGFGIEPFAAREVEDMDVGHAIIAIHIAVRAAPEPPGQGDARDQNQADKYCGASHSLTPRNRSELPMTETEDRLMAAAAIIGESSRPKNGNRMPAATGTPAQL